MLRSEDRELIVSMYNKFKDKLDLELYIPFTQEIQKIIANQKIEYFNSCIKHYTYPYDNAMIKYILTNPSVLTNLKSVFKEDNSTGFFQVFLYGDNGVKESLTTFSKSAFLKIAESCVTKMSPKKMKNAVLKLREIIDPKNLLNSDEVYSVSVGKSKEFNYTLPIKNIIKFYLEDYNLALYNNFEGVDTCGLTKEQFLYAVYSYAKETNLLNNFVFDDNAEKYFTELDKGSIMDFYTFKNINETIDSSLSEVELNDELINFILNGMPDNYSDLEKAVYIYIKMCRVFTYDPYFFASKEEGKSAKFHQNIERLKDLTPKNNRVVCYEFTHILGKFLNMLGIKYEIIESGQIYGQPGHSRLRFKANNIIVNADSTTSVLGGDLYYAKVHDKLVGLKSYSSRFQHQIDDVVSKVTKYIDKSENNENGRVKFEYWKKIYVDFCGRLKKSVLSIDERIDILKEQMERVGLAGIDAITYMQQLCKSLFDIEINQDRLSLSLVRKKIDSPETELEPLVVLSFKQRREKGGSTRYFIYNNDGSISEATKEMLQSKFNIKYYSYMNKDYGIPGLEP